MTAPEAHAVSQDSVRSCCTTLRAVYVRVGMYMYTHILLNTYHHVRMETYLDANIFMNTLLVCFIERIHMHIFGSSAPAENPLRDTDAFCGLPKLHRSPTILPRVGVSKVF